MNKIFLLLLSAVFIMNVNSQEQTGFGKSPDLRSYLDDSVIYSYINQLNSLYEESQYYQVVSIFYEVVDSARVILNSDDWNHQTYTDSLGIFHIPLSKVSNKSLANMKIFHKDYKGYDTTITIKKNISPFFQRLFIHPKHKILIRGRIVKGYLPIEDMNVIIEYNDTVYRTKTLGCYNDEGNYWNCLYNGMFKQDITIDDPDDSLFILVKKQGFKPLRHELRIAEYNGDILNFKVKYTDSLPFIPKHDACLKIAVPLPWEPSWFIGLSYHKTIKINKFNRLSVGAEGILLMAEETINVQNELPGTVQTDVDSVYITGFIGPSVRLSLTNPKKRYFSTYIGNTFSLSINKWEFVPQPYIGTKFYLDLNKAIHIECRYIRYTQDNIEYDFNAFGNASRNIKSVMHDKLIFNAGIQIVF